MKGSCYQRKKGGTWTIKYDLPRGPNGKRGQKEEAIPGTKANAEKVLAERLTEINNGKYVLPNRMNLSECLQKYMAYKVKEGSWDVLTEQSYASYANNYFIPDLGNVLLSELTTSGIQNYYDHLIMEGRSSGKRKKKGGLSGKSVRNYHGLLHGALDYAVARGYIAENPASAVKLPKHKKPDIFVLTEIQTDLVFREVQNTELELPTLVGFTTGVRREELLALKEEDIDLDNGTMKIQRAVVSTKKGLVVKKPKTEAGRRTITVPQVTLKALRDRIIAQQNTRLSSGPGFNEEKYLFTDENGEIWNPDEFSKTYSKLAKEIGIPGLNFKTLRHTHATRLLESGINAKVVSERLGHSDVAFTLRTYVHAQPKMELLAAGVMNRMVEEVTSRISTPQASVIANTNGQLSGAEELELFIRIKYGAASEESLKEEYGVSSSKIQKIEQMGIEGALEVLHQIKMKALAAPVAEDAHPTEVAAAE